MMRQYVYENLLLREVIDHFDAIESTAYYLAANSRRCRIAGLSILGQPNREWGQIGF
jgi:hypothetical protein